MSRIVRLMVIVALCALSLPAPALARDDTPQGSVSAQELTMQRIAGSDRYDTAVEISREYFQEAHSTVVIATGADWPDALCAAPLCSVYDAPLLLVKPDAVPAGVLNEIDRLAVTDAIILGGEKAVGPQVEATLKSRLGPSAVTRIAGSNRYDTSARIARIVMGDSSWSGRAFYATGENFPDALGASAIAAGQRMPILLTRTGALPPQTASVDGDVTRAYIVGGTAAVGTDVEAALNTQVGSSNVVRLAGANRYATTCRVVGFAVDYWGTDATGVGVSSGADFPDALAAGAALGRRNQAQLLTDRFAVPSETAFYLLEQTEVADSLTVFGGTQAISVYVALTMALMVDSDYAYTQILYSVFAWPTDAAPVAPTIIELRAIPADQIGRHIQGAEARFTLDSGPPSPPFLTDAENGVAAMPLAIQVASKGSTVQVSVTVTFDGKTAYGKTSFVVK